MVTQSPGTDMRFILKKMPFTLRVGNIPGGDTEFISIQAAMDYAGTQGGLWTIFVYPGIYDEGDLTPPATATVTIKGLAETGVYIMPAAAPVTAVVNMNDTLHLENITVIAPDATMPAVLVNTATGTPTITRCSIIGVAPGYSLQMTLGHLDIHQSGLSEDVHLSTARCVLDCYECNFFGDIITAAEALDHDIDLINCDMTQGNITSNATGATVVGASHTGDIATVTNAGTGLFTFRDCYLDDVSVTNAAGAIRVRGGTLNQITRAAGSVVWWHDDVTIDVLPSGLTTDTVIQHAVDAAAAGNITIRLHAGLYTEDVIMAATVSLVGEDKEQVHIDTTNGTAITMAANCRVANLRITALATAAGSAYAIECNDASCTIEDVNIYIDRTGGVECVGINENTGNAVATILIRNVRVTCEQVLNTNTHAVYIAQANKTVNIEQSYIQGADYGLHVTAASDVYSCQNYYETTAALARAVYNDGGNIYLTEDSIADGCRVVQVALSGTMIYTDTNNVYHVFEGMSIQDALTAGAGEEIHIHDGDHYPPNPAAPGAALTVAAGTFIQGSGKTCVIHGAAAAGNITNLMLLNGDNITIKDLKLILDAGCGTAGARPNVIYATGRTLIWLENLWTIGDTSVGDDGSEDRQNGIQFDNVDDSKILNCRVEDNFKSSIHLVNAADNNTISGNTCQGNTQHGIYLVTNCANNTITGNTCQGNTRYGIYLISDNNTVTGNTCQGNTQSGISLSNSDNNTVTGNTCQGNTQSGIYLTNSDNNTVTGNTYQGNTRHGIHLSGSDNNTMTGNTCADNDSAGNTYSGIYITNSQQNVITGNQCDSNGLHGIFLHESSYCSVTGNGCNNQNTGDGIHVAGDAPNADYNTLTGNVCTGNASDGIEISEVGAGDANKNIVIGNQLLGNGGLALNDGGTNTEVAHNITV